MRQVLPIPEELIALPVCMSFPNLLRAQATAGGIAVPPSQADYHDALRVCAAVHYAEPKWRYSSVKTRGEATFKAKDVVSAWKDQLWAATKERAIHATRPAVPIPPLLLLLNTDRAPTYTLIDMHFDHGGVPLPMSEDDYIACLQFVRAVLATYSLRKSVDRRSAKLERAAAEEFQSALYKATRDRANFKCDSRLSLDTIAVMKEK